MCRRDINQPHTEFKLISKKITGCISGLLRAGILSVIESSDRPGYSCEFRKKASGTRNVIKLQ